MSASIIIAKIIGPVLLIAAIPMLMNPSYMRQMAEEFINSKAWIFMAGLMALIPGVAILATHYVWQGWPIVITLFGWIMVFAGIVRLMFPTFIQKIAKNMMKDNKMIIGGALLWLFFGAFLTYQGYLA